MSFRVTIPSIIRTIPGIKGAVYLYYDQKKFYITKKLTMEEQQKYIIIQCQINNNIHTIPIPKLLCNEYNVDCAKYTNVIFTYDFNTEKVYFELC